MQNLYYGGDIITMRDINDTPEAVLLIDDKIAYVGSLKKARSLCNKECKEINLNGNTLMPAFIDSHSHLSMLAQLIKFCNLSSCENFNQIITQLKTFQEKNEITEQRILIGWGYDHNFLIEQQHPDKNVLDMVSVEMPICILHASGHICVANSAMLELSGISKNTIDPSGGKFGRDAHGFPNGYIEEIPAVQQVLFKAFSLIKQKPVEQFLEAQQIYVQNGITTVQDGATVLQAFEFLKKLSDENLFQVDLVSYIMAEDYKYARDTYSNYMNSYINHLRIGGAKIILDGSPQGRTAWLSKPYEGKNGVDKGYPLHETAEVDSIVKQSVDGGYQLLAHCNGDAASQQFLDSYEKAITNIGNETLDLRPVMVHCQTVRDDQLARMAELKMLPSFFIAHTYYWGEVHLKNLGQKRGEHISPANSALAYGLRYTFHQDTPVVYPNMLHTIWCAVVRKSRTGKTIGRDECIEVYEALQAVTIHAAYQYHEEKQKGSIEIGKLADMVIIDKNPLKINKMKIKDISVLETIKAGKVIYAAPITNEVSYEFE